jgi:signal transduction histidine kinase
MENLGTLRDALTSESKARERAECLAEIQTNAVQLALDLLVREPNIESFFAAFTRALVEDCECHACGVWLIDEDQRGCELWMAYLGDRLVTLKSDDWAEMTLPRESMSAHLFESKAGWSQTIEYGHDDQRLPEAVRNYNRQNGVDSFAVAPLVLGDRNLGWIGISTYNCTPCEWRWRVAVLEAMARQATLALHQSQMAERSRREERRKAILEERNRLARDIHDNLAQGFAAILMQLQAAQREAASLPPSIAAILDTTVDLARNHLTEARKSVCALRPNGSNGEDVATALKRIADVSRRTSGVPIDVSVEELPRLGSIVEKEIVRIAQEALTNAVRHARAKRITIRASTVRSIGFRLSVADDGRGIAGDRRAAGFGMTSMQERAERIGASLTVVTAPRNGTEVVLAWEPSALPTQVHVAS